MPEMAREYTRVGGQMETAKKQRTARLNPRWCSPNDADKDYKVMELLRPAVLGCCDSRDHASGVHNPTHLPTHDDRLFEGAAPSPAQEGCAFASRCWPKA